MNRVLIIFLFFVVIAGFVICEQAVCDIVSVSRHPGDFNSDGIVDSEDLVSMAGQWLQPPADPNCDIAPVGGDGIVNMRDFSVFSNGWLNDSALPAAQAGIDYAMELLTWAPTANTYSVAVTDSEADLVWNNLCQYLQAIQPGGQTVPDPTVFSDAGGNGSQIMIPTISCGVGDVSFTLRFYRYDSDLRTILIDSSGINGGINRVLAAEAKLEKEDGGISQYAVISKSRIDLEGDTTVHGHVYSLWNRAEISPFHAADTTAVIGTYNTVLTKEQIDGQTYQLETLDENGNPLFDEFGNRIVSDSDEIQGAHEGVNYDHQSEIISAYLDIDNYDTSYYTDEMSLTTIEPNMMTETQTVRIGRWPNYTYTTVEVEVPVTTTEYFPHDPNGYNDYTSGSVTLHRYTYEGQTYSNAFLPANQNALFKNCTFEDVLYIDCSPQTSGDYNNVRFENCVFHGVIVTNTPDELNWRYNTLYFTGSAHFINTSEIEEAIILAPHFNIDLGQTVTASGIIIGGIVDVRGNADIFGTIISMCDTSQWTNGYVTNIGMLYDGSESYPPEDVGTINIYTQPYESTQPLHPTAIIIVPLDVYEKEI